MEKKMHYKIKSPIRFSIRILGLLFVSIHTLCAQAKLFENYHIDPQYTGDTVFPDAFGEELVKNGGVEDHNGSLADGWRDDSAWAPVKTLYSIETRNAF
ncbi:MAG TPA: hypothetical protein DC049_09795, partial [Spirochaetia bacterium]|nr:hypothetical protein [Spirochaetia bacterium]